MFIGELRKYDDIEGVKKLFKDCFYQQDGRHNNTRFEMKALEDTLKELPDGPKKDEPAEDGDKIKIEFYDVADPGKLDDPEEPSDADKEKYEPLGDPAELTPGEDVPTPDVPEKDGYEFMGFDPDPEDMDESGKTYATYEKTEEEADPEEETEPEATPDEDDSNSGEESSSEETTGEEE